MATNTPIYDFILPAVNSPTDEDLWGGELNENFTSLDSLLNTATNFIKSNQTTTTAVDLTFRNKIILADATSAAFDVDLPAAATAGDGFTLAIKKTDASANAVTIDPNGAETIDGAASYALSSQNDAVLIMCDGTGWKIISTKLIVSAATTTTPGIIELLTDAEFLTGTDSTRAVLVSNFVKSASSNGYIKLPGGIIIQWGYYNGAANAWTVTFPTAFASACYSMTGSCDVSGQILSVTTLGTTSASGVTRSFSGASNNIPFYWIAVGK